MRFKILFFLIPLLATVAVLWATYDYSHLTNAAQFESFSCGLPFAYLHIDFASYKQPPPNPVWTCFYKPYGYVPMRLDYVNFLASFVTVYAGLFALYMLVKYFFMRRFAAKDMHKNFGNQ